MFVIAHSGNPLASKTGGTSAMHNPMTKKRLITLIAAPAVTKSFVVSLPDPKQIRLGGVATGMMKQQLVAKAVGIIKTHG